MLREEKSSPKLIAFALEDGYPAEEEWVWALPRGCHRFAIASAPVFVPGIAVGDVVSTVSRGGEEWAEELLEQAGRATLRVLARTDVPHEGRVALLRELRAACVGPGVFMELVSDLPMLVLTVERDADVERLCVRLAAFEEAGRGVFEEAALPDWWNSGAPVTKSPPETTQLGGKGASNVGYENASDMLDGSAFVAFALEDGYAVESENICAVPLGQGRYRVALPPAFVPGISVGDIVDTVVIDGQLWADEIVEEGGRATLRAAGLPFDPTPRQEEVLERLAGECQVEGVEMHFAMDLPMLLFTVEERADIRALHERLEAFEARGDGRFEESALPLWWPS